MTRLILVMPLTFLLAACETDFQRCFDTELSKLQTSLLVEGSAASWIDKVQSLSGPQRDASSPSGFDAVWLEEYVSVQAESMTWIWSSPPIQNGYIKALDADIASVDSGGEGYLNAIRFFKEVLVPIAQEDVRSEESLFAEATETCHSRGIY
jgi:hypothetical protein|tara:strand:+ start:181 stop:636 length:456 start_codon:yes stop_codon:yes gene_type:complete